MRCGGKPHQLLIFSLFSSPTREFQSLDARRITQNNRFPGVFEEHKLARSHVWLPASPRSRRATSREEGLPRRWSRLNRSADRGSSGLERSVGRLGSPAPARGRPSGPAPGLPRPQSRRRDARVFGARRSRPARHSLQPDSAARLDAGGAVPADRGDADAAPAPAPAIHSIGRRRPRLGARRPRGCCAGSCCTCGYVGCGVPVAGGADARCEWQRVSFSFGGGARRGRGLSCAHARGRRRPR